jgi:hypothetical protein
VRRKERRGPDGGGGNGGAGGAARRRWWWTRRRDLGHGRHRRRYSGSGGVTVDAAQDHPADASSDVPRPTPRLTWTLMTPGWDASYISGAANGEIWIANRGGSALQIRADGTSAATDLQLSTSAYVTGLWVAGPNNAYVSAYANLVLHWDGSGTWKRDIMTSGTIFNSVWGSGPADVYAGHRPRCVPLRRRRQMDVAANHGDDAVGLRLADRNRADDLWLAGDHGEIFRSTGDATWRRETSTDVYYVNQLWAASPSEAYFVTSLAIMHRLPSTGSWVAETPLLAGNEHINAIWGSGSNDVYAGTDQSRLFHSVGDGVWRDDGFNGNAGIHGIWGRNAGDVYLATSSGIFHGVP